MSGVLRSTTTVFLVALGLAALSGPAQGDGGDRPKGQAIQFGIGSSFRLGTFAGTTLSYQRFLSEQVAWRIGVSIDADYETVEVSQTSTGDVEIDGSDELTQWDHSLSAVSEWLVYRGSVVSVYFGGGPRVSYSTGQHENVYHHEESWRMERRRASELGAGVAGVIGVQWGAADSLALHAEYRVHAMYVHETSDRWAAEGGTQNYVAELHTSIDSFELDSQGVRFGLSVYF